MINREIAAIFEQMADLMELLEENRFRILSYRRAARAISELPEDVAKLAAENRLQDVDGIGESTAEKIHQYIDTGKIAQYEELAEKVPPGAAGMMRIPNLGAKTVIKLWKEAGIVSEEQLRAALEGDLNELKKLHGMGEKKIQQLRQSLQFLQSAGGRIRLGDAQQLADDLLAVVAGCEQVDRAVTAGSLRRGKETIGDIDLLCQAPAAKAAGIIEAFTSAGPAFHDGCVNLCEAFAMRMSKLLQLCCVPGRYPWFALP